MSASRYNAARCGGVPEWPKGTGCKPVGSAFRGSNPLSPTSPIAALRQVKGPACGGAFQLGEDRLRTCGRQRGRPCGRQPSSARSCRPASSSRPSPTSCRRAQTHLEPLAEPAAASPVPEGERAAEAEALLRIVVEATGAEPRELRLLNTEVGIVAFLTLAMDPSRPLAEAHALASDVEERIRRAHPGFADVVVHTEP